MLVLGPSSPFPFSSSVELLLGSISYSSKPPQLQGIWKTKGFRDPYMCSLVFASKEGYSSPFNPDMGGGEKDFR